MLSGRIFPPPAHRPEGELAPSSPTSTCCGRCYSSLNDEQKVALPWLGLQGGLYVIADGAAIATSQLISWVMSLSQTAHAQQDTKARQAGQRAYIIHASTVAQNDEDLMEKGSWQPYQKRVPACR